MISLITSLLNTPNVSTLFGLPAFDWLAVLAGLMVLVWFVLSNWEKFERVAGWLSAGRRRREAAFDGRLSKLETEVRDFVGKSALEEQFGAIHKQLDIHKAAHLASKETQHSAQSEFDKQASALRQNSLDIVKLQHLEPRLTEAEKSIAVIIQKMSDLEKGQDRIIDNQRDNLETVLSAIRDAKK